MIGGREHPRKRQKLNSIEKFDKITSPAIFLSLNKWQLIETVESFEPRIYPVFRAWNKQEIVILGGIDNDRRILGDGWVLDTKDDTLRQVLHPCENSLKFFSEDN